MVKHGLYRIGLTSDTTEVFKRQILVTHLVVSFAGSVSQCYRRDGSPTRSLSASQLVASHLTMQWTPMDGSVCVLSSENWVLARHCTGDIKSVGWSRLDHYNQLSSIPCRRQRVAIAVWHIARASRIARCRLPLPKQDTTNQLTQARR